MRWGLIPSWAKDQSIGSRMINARAETLSEKPSFRDAFRKRRCLVVADGFYEWQKVAGRKRPMRIVLQTGEPFAFAGLWESWRDPEGTTVRSCTIITTGPNSLIEPIHNRMPVILSRDDEARWLDPEMDDPPSLLQMLAPYPQGAMDAYEISTLVNSPANDVPDCIERLRLL
jgi:putative SOS response-associated peptidase YedK